MDSSELAGLIDHTELSPTASDRDIEKLAGEALKYRFACACVNGRHVKLLSSLLAGRGVLIATVAGFPLGAGKPAAKADEASRAADDGADEVDMVISIGDLLSGRDGRVANEIRRVRRAIPHVTLKVILECGLLPDDRKTRGAELAVEAGADFVKTSTGFLGSGATVEDVRLLRKAVGPEIGVKASGGIRTYEQAVAMVRAGADRLGTSAGPAIVVDLRRR